jgi:O-antigen/teichoic acid export membrane protein
VTLLLETDLPLAVAAPAAIALAILAIAYWRRLESPDVPETRRRIRRFSLLLALVLLPALVWSSSLVDHRADPAAYIGGWLACFAILALIVFVAVVDALHSFVLHRREWRRHRDRYADAFASDPPASKEDSR